MNYMFYFAATVNQYFVKKNYNNKLSQEWEKDLGHGGLEGGGCVCEPKRHDGKLIVSFVSAKSHFLNIPPIHSDLMITRL